MIYKLKNIVQEYNWGSKTEIQNLLGLKNINPIAELWMGAHPKAPSEVISENKNIPLTVLIKNNPESVLGKNVIAKYGAKLPFLFKVLAAGKSLSIQAHPNKNQAVLGFEKEDNNNIPLYTPNRNYKDKNHKPELICALSDFWAMRGFRPIAEIIAELKKLKLTNLKNISEDFFNNPSESGLKTFFNSIMKIDKKELLVKEVLKRTENMKGSRYEWIKKLNNEHPDDIGVICPLILNLVKLEPGQAMYLPAGELHSYLSGTGIEIMANSDNVLRGGLTIKYIDVDELLKTLTFKSGYPEIIQPVKSNENEEIYNTEAEEFKLFRIKLENSQKYIRADLNNIEIMIIIKGNCRIQSSCLKKTIEAKKGNSFLIESNTGEYTISGDCLIFKATV